MLIKQSEKNKNYISFMILQFSIMFLIPLIITIIYDVHFSFWEEFGINSLGLFGILFFSIFSDILDFGTSSIIVYPILNYISLFFIFTKLYKHINNKSIIVILNIIFTTIFSLFTSAMMSTPW